MRTILSAAALLWLASPLAAQTTPPADAGATAPAKDEPKICRRLEQTGSRMGSKRVCHTANEWQAVDAAAERTNGGASNMRSKPN